MPPPPRPPAAPDPFDELHRRQRPWWLLFVALAVAAAVAGVVYKRRHPAAPPARYVTARVSSGDVVETIEATGAVQPVLQVQVGSQVSGRVARVHVDFNSRVHTGDLLAELDPVPLQLQVSQGRAAVGSAQASLVR